MGQRERTTHTANLQQNSLLAKFTYVPQQLSLTPPDNGVGFLVDSHRLVILHTLLCSVLMGVSKEPW